MAGAAGGDLLSGLCAEHQEEVVKVMNFFKNKRKQTLAMVETDFAEAQDMLVSEEYSRSDVEDHLNQVKHVVADGMRHEMETVVSMSVLLLQQVFERAEQQGVVLELDMSKCEDQRLLSQVEEIRLEQSFQAERKTPSKKGALTSIKDEHQELVREKNRLEQSQQDLTKRMNQMQMHSNSMLREKARLAEEVASLRETLKRAEEDALRADGAAQAKDVDAKAAQESAAVHSQELARIRRQLDDTVMRLREAEEETSTRLNQSKQVQQMRKMLNDKNDVIRDLRVRLKKYEPDTLQADEHF